MTKTQDAAVRNYLTSLRDPEALRDDDAIADLHTKVEQTDDELERLQLRQQLLDLQTPPLDRYETAFVEHSKAWADTAGITSEAFLAEGVPAASCGAPASAACPRAAVAPATVAAPPRANPLAREVGSAPTRSGAAIPSGSFTVKDLQERSGASAAVVRRVINEEVDAGNLTDQGADPDHTGPGRAPTIYQPA